MPLEKSSEAWSGGLVGAIQDAIGPGMLKSLEAANWLGQVAECLETISKILSTDAHAAGYFKAAAKSLVPIQTKSGSDGE